MTHGQVHQAKWLATSAATRFENVAIRDWQTGVVVIPGVALLYAGVHRLIATFTASIKIAVSAQTWNPLISRRMMRCTQRHQRCTLTCARRHRVVSPVEGYFISSHRQRFSRSQVASRNRAKHRLVDRRWQTSIGFGSRSCSRGVIS